MVILSGACFLCLGKLFGVVKMAFSGMTVSMAEGVAVATLAIPSIQEEDVIRQIREALFDLVDVKAQRKLVIDFSKVSFLSSQMISVAISLDKKIGSLGGKLILAGLEPNLKKIFVITKLNKILSFADNAEIAVQKLQKKNPHNKKICHESCG